MRRTSPRSTDGAPQRREPPFRPTTNWPARNEGRPACSSLAEGPIRHLTPP